MNNQAGNIVCIAISIMMIIAGLLNVAYGELTGAELVGGSLTLIGFMGAIAGVYDYGFQRKANQRDSEQRARAIATYNAKRSGKL